MIETKDITMITGGYIMEWIKSLRTAINYMEEHMYEDIHADDVADAIYMSSFYFQKGFKIITGYTIKEYIRYRRLYLAALDVMGTDDKIIDIADRYHYDTPESFTKAFLRFHGVSPMQLKKEPSRIKAFLPLRISISIEGGNEMDYIIEEVKEIEVVGFIQPVATETAYVEIPNIWDRLWQTYVINKEDKAILDMMETCSIGEFAICVDDHRQSDEFRYMIAGRYHGESIPEGMMIYTIPAGTYVKFHCKGPLPGALQSVNTRIYKEWLPQHPEYVFHGNCNVEWYRKGDTQANDYESEIWIPVERRQ